jgi:hypothetical protein
MKHIAICLLIFLTSCAGSQAWQSMQISSTVREAKKNNANIQKIKLGMSKQEVVDVLGSPTKSESYDLGKERSIEFLFYRTEGWSVCDLQNKDSQFTPFAFENNKLIGWGRNYYEKVIQHSLEIKVNKSLSGTIPKFAY